MEVWVKTEPQEAREVICIICLKELSNWRNQSRQREIYENLIQKKIKTPQITIAFCSACSQRLIAIEEFKEICKNSLNQLEESYAEQIVVIEEIRESPNIFELQESQALVLEKKKKNPRNTQQSKPKKRKIVEFSQFCRFCELPLDTVTFDDHLQQVHIDNSSLNSFDCKLCKRRLETLNNALSHFGHQHASSDNLNPEKCLKCGLGVTESRYPTHRCYYEMNRYLLECHFCSKKYSSRKAIHEHICVQHLGARDCQYCRRYFLDKDEYKKHMDEEQKRWKGNIKTYLCNICGKVFKKYKVLLSLHHAREHSAGNYPCKVCGRVFRMMNDLKRHFTEIHGERNLICHFCGKKYATKTTMAHHMREYHMNNNQTCDVCGKIYPKYRINAHRKTHSNERLHECPYCSDSFKCKATLNKHLYSHSNTRPFNCLKCNTGYYMIEYLKAHYKRMHDLVYTNKECYENCRREKPPYPNEDQL